MTVISAMQIGIENKLDLNLITYLFMILLEGAISLTTGQNENQW